MSQRDVDLISYARKHLGLAENHPVPQGFLKELKKHVISYPQDINFRIVPQPGVGYGTLYCLEPLCQGLMIPLTRKVPDDGAKVEGIGSLWPYREHINTHPAHTLVRQARMNTENNTPHVPWSLATRAPRKSGVLSALNANFGPPGSSSTTSKPRIKADNHGSTHRSKPTYSDVRPDSSASHASSSSVGRKRASLPFDPVASSSQSYENQNAWQLGSGPPPKKMKPDPNVQDESRPTYIQAAIQKARPAIKSDPFVDTKRRDLDVSRIISLKDDVKTEHHEPLINHMLPPLDAYQRPPSRFDAYQQPPSRFDAYQRPPSLFDAYQPPPGSTKAIGTQWPYRDEFSSDASGPGVHDADSDSEPESESSSLQRLLHPKLEADSGDLFPNGLPSLSIPVPRYNAKPEEIQNFITNACNSEQFSGNATVEDALKKLNIPDLRKPLSGMSIRLMPHQAIGVAWMVDHEKMRYKGAILADEMGLGKTVQIIATMCMNHSDDPRVKTTLIVAPMALLHQWKEEILTKTDDMFEVLIYHGPRKPKTQKDLQKYDVIITTYQTLALEWPDEDEQEKKKKRRNRRKKDDFVTDGSSADEKKKTKKRKPGPLLGLEYFRVVLDEAQNIRNKNTRVSRAVTQLTSTYRWCLTGTPVTNSLTDCYPYFRFLQIRPWYDWDEYNSHIALIEKRNPSLASSRLQTIFGLHLLRRKKDSMLDGKRLVELPPREVTLEKLQFSPEEQAIYTFVEARSQLVFNRFLRAGTVLKNYRQVFVLLLRLRQICCHPCLIAEHADGFVIEHPNDKERLGELDRAATLAGPEFVETMKAKLKEQVLERMAQEKESADAAIEDAECPICYEHYYDAVVTPCCHEYCRACITTILEAPPVEDANEPSAYKIDERPCPQCRAPIKQGHIFDRRVFEPTDSDLEDNSDCEDTKPTKGKGKGKAFVPRRSLRAKRKSYFGMDLSDADDDDDLSDFIVQSDEDEEEKDRRRDEKKNLRKSRKKMVIQDSSDNEFKMDIDKEAPEEPEDDEEQEPMVLGKKLDETEVFNMKKPEIMPKFLPSTKMKYMMEQLQKWRKEYPDDKVMIISQWTSCLDLVSDYLGEIGIKHVRYQGTMNRTDRDEAVRTFMSDKTKVPVMLMSLKCGGVGLNLTRGNRVISMDLAWSTAVENQAFDRVHRLGQTKPVHIERLIIDNTVESRVLGIQERKQNLADGSLGEGSGKKIGRLSVRELASLFGLDAFGNRLSS